MNRMMGYQYRLQGCEVDGRNKLVQTRDVEKKIGY